MSLYCDRSAIRNGGLWKLATLSSVGLFKIRHMGLFILRPKTLGSGRGLEDPPGALWGKVKGIRHHAWGTWQERFGIVKIGIAME